MVSDVVLSSSYAKNMQRVGSLYLSGGSSSQERAEEVIRIEQIGGEVSLPAESFQRCNEVAQNAADEGLG